MERFFAEQAVLQRFTCHNWRVIVIVGQKMGEVGLFIRDLHCERSSICGRYILFTHLSFWSFEC